MLKHPTLHASVLVLSTALLLSPAATAANAQLRQPRSNAPPALPAVKSITGGAKFQAPGASTGSATGGQEIVLRVELTGPAPCMERCGGKTVNGAPSGYMRVRLSGDNTSQFSLQQMSVNTGQSVGEVNFVTAPVTAPTSFTVSAWTEGSAPKQTRLTVLPPVLTSFALSKSDIVSGEAVRGVAHFSGPPASATAVRFQVQTTNGQAVQVPATVTLELHKTAAEFDIQTLGVAQDRDVHVVAMYLGKALPAPLSVRPARLTDLEQVWPCCRSPFWIYLDGLPPPSGAVIELRSEDPSEIAVPPSVTIPAGVTKIAVTPQEIPGNTHRHVTITAKYRGVSKNHWVWSVKLVKPDIVIDPIVFYDQYGNVITSPPDGQPVKMCATVRDFRPNDLAPNVAVPPSVLRVSYSSPTGTGTGIGRTIDLPIAFVQGTQSGNHAPVTQCLTLPGLSQGDYHDITLTADFRQEVDESREGNNTEKVRLTRPAPND